MDNLELAWLWPASTCQKTPGKLVENTTLISGQKPVISLFFDIGFLMMSNNYLIKKVINFLCRIVNNDLLKFFREFTQFLGGYCKRNIVYSTVLIF